MKPRQNHTYYDHYKHSDGEESEEEKSKDDVGDISRYSSVTTLLRNSPYYASRKSTAATQELEDRYSSVYSDSSTLGKDRRHSIASDISWTSVETEDLLDRSIYYPVNLGGDLNITIQSDDKTVLEILNTPVHSARYTSGINTPVHSARYTYGITSDRSYQSNLKDKTSFLEQSQPPLTNRSAQTTHVTDRLKIQPNMSTDITAKTHFPVSPNDLISELSTTSSLYGKSGNFRDTNSFYEDSVVELLRKSPSSWKENCYYESGKVQLAREQCKPQKRGYMEDYQHKEKKKSSLLSPEFHKLKDYFSSQRNVTEVRRGKQSNDVRFNTSPSFMPDTDKVVDDGRLYKRFSPLVNSTRLDAPNSTGNIINPSNQQEDVQSCDNSAHVQTLEGELMKIDRILTEMKSELTRHHHDDSKIFHFYQDYDHAEMPASRIEDVSDISSEKGEIHLLADDESSKVRLRSSDVGLSSDEDCPDDVNASVHSKTSESIHADTNKPIHPDASRSIHGELSSNLPYVATPDVSSDICAEIHSVKRLLEFLLKSENDSNEELRTVVRRTEDVLEAELTSEKSYTTHTTDHTLQNAKKLLFRNLPSIYKFEGYGNEVGLANVDRYDHGEKVIQDGAKDVFKRLPSYANLPVENQSSLGSFPEMGNEQERVERVHSSVPKIDRRKNKQVDGNAHALLSRGHRDGQLESLKQMLFSLQEIEQENLSASKSEHKQTKLAQPDNLKSRHNKTLTRACSHLENLKSILQERRVIFNRLKNDVSDEF